VSGDITLTPSPEDGEEPVAGVTAPPRWFDAYTTRELHSFLRFWEDKKRSAGQAEKLLRVGDPGVGPNEWQWLPDRFAHIEALKLEIELREKGGGRR
jgi:hypothetical protein